MNALIPWPPRHQRKAAIRRARGEKERSRRDAVHAGTVQADIEALAARNHIAAALARQLIQQHGQQGAS